MLLGVGLLLAGSVKFTTGPLRPIRAFPLSGPRLSAVGGDEATRLFPVSHPAVPLPKDEGDFTGSLTATSALVVDDATGAVLFAKNTDRVWPLASITKLMSALILAELPLSWASTTIITEADADGSSHHLEAGEEYALDDLWHIALVGSSNSALSSLVRASGLATAEVVAKMNAKARGLHLDSLRFTEPTGLSATNVGAAFDVARLLKAALKNDRVYRALSTSEYYALPRNKKERRRVWTTNWLLTNWVPNAFDKDALAGKTGFIVDSAYNFAVRLKNDSDHALRVVVLGATSSETRFSEARDLAEWSYAHFVWPDQPGYNTLVKEN